MSLLIGVALAQAAIARIDFVGCEVMSEASARQLPVLAQAFGRPELANLRFEVEGHAARTEDPASDLALSRRFAEEVFTQLVEGGVDRARLELRVRGSERPRVPQLPEDNDNCRVEFRRLG